MTHADVESTISRLKAWMRARQGNDDWSVVLNDLEALRQHDEARAAAMEVRGMRGTVLARRVGSVARERARVLRAAAEGKP